MAEAKLVSYTQNYKQLLELACSKPYDKVVSLKAIVDHIVASGHLSVLEHCYASFEVKCSVRVLGQLTRHRHLSFTVKSARGSKFDKMVIPEGLRTSIGNLCKIHGVDDEYLPAAVNLTIDVVSEAMLKSYDDALAGGAKEQDAAYLLPQGVETSLVVTGNFRAWLEYLPKRLCQRAMPEHRELAELIHKELATYIPELFDKRLMNCATCTERSCQFK